MSLEGIIKTEPIDPAADTVPFEISLPSSSNVTELKQKSKGLISPKQAKVGQSRATRSPAIAATKIRTRLPKTRVRKGARKPAPNAGFTLENRLFRCSTCGKHYQQQSLMKRHIMHHQRSTTNCHKCTDCSVPFYVASSKALLQHINNNHPAVFRKRQQTILINRRCKICGIFIFHGLSIEKHMEKHERKDKPFECYPCKLYFSTVTMLNSHKSAEHKASKTERKSKMQSCVVCLQIFSESKMRTHKMVHQKGRKQYKCEICEFELYFKDKKSLFIHQKKCHGAGKKKAKTCCEICFQPIHIELRLHLKYHTRTEQRNIQCKLCDFDMFFETESGFKMHQKKVHGIEAIQKVCGICGLEDWRPNLHMRRHLRTVLRSEPCPICPQTWFDKSALRRHLTREHGEEELEAYDRSKLCHICHLVPETVSHMRCHVQSDKQRWQCAVCPTTWFLTYDELEQHVNTFHDNEYDGMDGSRSGLCLVCHLEEATAIHIKCHVPSKKRSWPCHICPTTWFPTKRALWNHVESFHRTQPAIGIVKLEPGQNEIPMEFEEPNSSQTTKLCEICGLRNATKVHMARHEYSTTRSHPCPVCPRTWFKEWYILKLHMEDYHPNDYQRFIADHVKPQQKATPNKHQVRSYLETLMTGTVEQRTTHQLHQRQTESISSAERKSLDEPKLQKVNPIFAALIRQNETLNAFVKHEPSLHTTVKHNEIVSHPILERALIKCENYDEPSTLTHHHSHKPTNQRSTRCPICPQTWFLNVDSLNSHLKSCHHQTEVKAFKVEEEETANSTQHNVKSGPGLKLEYSNNIDMNENSECMKMEID